MVMKKKALKRNIEGYIFIAPWLVGFLGLFLFPVGWSLYLAFTDYDFVTSQHFTGMDNINKLVHTDLFWHSLMVTFKYSILAVPIHLMVALLAALAMNIKLKGIGLYRTAYYLPSIIGGTMGVAIMWKLVFTDTGIANSLLNSLGLGSFQFLNYQHALYTLVGISSWSLGGPMLIFLAGLQNISPELYESAKVDGAGAFRRLRSITLPLLTPVIFFNLIMGIIGALQTFSGAFVITGRGGPAQATYFFVLYLYEEGFQYFHMGFASLLAWVLFVIILAFTLLVLKSQSAWVHYEAEVKGGNN
jgi:ABC-type sugar transport system permease subunit